MMMSEVADQQHIRMNGAQLPPNISMANFRREMPEQFKRWGFDCMAIDLIEGPELVLAWLCHREKLHLIVSRFAFLSRDLTIAALTFGLVACLPRPEPSAQHQGD